MLTDFLQPLDIHQLNIGDNSHDNHIGNHIQIHQKNDFPDIENLDLAIFGVLDDRGSINNKGCGLAADEVRKHLYQLDKGYHNLKMADLGNILPGAGLSDTYAAVGDVMSDLLSANIIPIIIGGGHDITYGQYKGYAKNDRVINMAVIDEAINIYKHHDSIDSESFLYRIFTETPNYLFNFSQIGFQSYFVSPADIATLEKLYFEFYRLGKVRENMEEVEPIIRDADMLSFDISAIKQSDAPGKRNATPHGFYGEEGCKIARYAGITDKLTSIGFYEMNPECDRNSQTAQLIAQMIWYFLDGFYNRTNEFPIVNDREFVKYTVDIEESEFEMIFWKSKRSGRWWMQIPETGNVKYERHQLIPCSYADYQLACNEEIPERWMRAFEKVS